MGRLDGFEQEQKKPWRPGWYRSVVVEEYEAGSSVFRTQDRETKNGETRQLQLCVVAANANGAGKPDTKYLNYSVYYRPAQLGDPVYLEKLREYAKTQPANQKWSDPARQSDFINFGKLWQVEKAINNGADLPFAATGGLDISHTVGAELDVKVAIYRKGNKYDEQVPKDILDDYFKENIKWGKDGAEKWWYGVDKVAPAGSMTDKK